MVPMPVRDGENVETIGPSVADDNDVGIADVEDVARAARLDGDVEMGPMVSGRLEMSSSNAASEEQRP
jgi:hypothetical protein